MKKPQIGLFQRNLKPRTDPLVERLEQRVKELEQKLAAHELHSGPMV